MIEVPSAALSADHLAREVKFFSIGTNDLIQYAIAVDRGNDHIAHLYQPTHPSIIRMIKAVVDAARRRNIWTGVCGEMAGDIQLTPLLLGLGVDELSASSTVVPRVKKAVQSLSMPVCEALGQRGARARHRRSHLAALPGHRPLALRRVAGIAGCGNLESADFADARRLISSPASVGSDEASGGAYASSRVMFGFSPNNVFRRDAPAAARRTPARDNFQALGQSGWETRIS